MYKCCNNPNYVRAYTPSKPFKAKYCLNCHEVISDAHPIVEWLFTWVFAPFWNGAVKVNFIPHIISAYIVGITPI